MAINPNVVDRKLKYFPRNSNPEMLTDEEIEWVVRNRNSLLFSFRTSGTLQVLREWYSILSSTQLEYLAHVNPIHTFYIAGHLMPLDYFDNVTEYPPCAKGLQLYKIKMALIKYNCGGINFKAFGHIFPYLQGVAYLSTRTVNKSFRIGDRFGITWATCYFFYAHGTQRWSSLIVGIDADGDIIQYNRRETEHRSAGQTKLYCNGKHPVAVTDALRGLFNYAEWKRKANSKGKS